uniref:Erythroid membrane-associated protein-like n=1 Tax=Kryptolebias marmoratus TaxID=37003 RepID=A0A3Q3AWM8_KRYMA
MSLIRVSVAHVGLLFLLACSSCSGSASADVPRTITAYVKETTLLPCSITHEDDLPTMEWSKEGITPNITFLYRDGCETFAEKNPDFLHRTNLVLDNLKDGNLSQIIYNLRLSDGGRYQCRTLRGRRWQVEATVDLVVVAVSEPKLTVVPSAGDGVLLQCKAECWSSEPTVMFLDDQGNEIKAKDPKRDEALARCFTVTRRATLQAGTNRVICRAKHMNKTRDTEMYIPDNWMSSCSYIIAIVVTIGATFLFTCGLCLCRDRLCRKHGDIGKSIEHFSQEQIKPDVYFIVVSSSLPAPHQ